MEWILVYAPALACVAMMLVVCIPMMRRMSSGHEEHGPAPNEEIAALREEVALLRAERALEYQSEEAIRG